MSDQSRLIHDYLDGSLNGAREEHLFSELSRDSELRQEFSDQLAIHRAASQDMNSIGVPAAASSKLFSELGIEAVPLGSLPVAAGAAAGAGFFERFRGMIFASAAALVLTGISTYFALQSPDKENSIAQKNSPARNEEKISAVPLANSAIEEKSIARNFSQSEEKISSGGIFRSERKISAEKNSVEKNFASEEKLSKQTLLADIEGRTYSPETALENISQSGNQYSSVNSNVRDNFHVSVELPIIAQLRTGADITALNSADYTASFLYPVLENSYLSIEIGSENFFQNYERNIQDENKSFSENNSMFVGSFAFRQMIPSWTFLNTTPFAQLGAGGAISATGGFTGKVLVGAQYGSLDDRFNAMIGLENTQLWYYVQNKNYSTNKTSLVAGVGIRF